MSIFNWGEQVKAIAEPVEALGNAFDKIFTSDEERAQGEAVLTKIRMQPSILNAELNKIEAQHKSIFIAGWRPTIGYICAAGLAFPFIVNPVLQWVTGEPGPDLPLDAILELAIAMLGLAGLRTVEKLQGRAK
jgi:hypothetical protein